MLPGHDWRHKMELNESTHILESRVSRRIYSSALSGAVYIHSSPSLTFGLLAFAVFCSNFWRYVASSFVMRAMSVRDARSKASVWYLYCYLSVLSFPNVNMVMISCVSTRPAYVSPFCTRADTLVLLKYSK